MSDTVLHYCNDDSMRLSYVYETYWRQWIRKQKTLEEAMQPIELYIALERIMSSKTEFHRLHEDDLVASLAATDPGPLLGTDRGAPRWRRCFSGTVLRLLLQNRRPLMLGHALKEMLDYLEQRYGIDFKELERAHQEAAKDPVVR